ncbi:MULTISPECIES: DoxX family protein [Thioalkalivibrio]|uniref:DoxX family protein n=1 Tax=Thioalkalivibrio TaxID=106633 RepID=UPI00035D2A4A|nr:MULTISPECIES: DoxX family protein [Thioalkalivibrio]
MATTTSNPSLFRALQGPAALDSLAPLAWPLVRITAGLLLIPHGAQKLFGWFGGHGLTGTAEYFGGTLGFEPGLLFALAAGIIEVFGGLLLALGLLTRPVALVVAAFLAVTITVHWSSGFFWTEGGFEFPLMWTLVALAIFFRGGGRWSLDAALRR